MEAVFMLWIQEVIRNPFLNPVMVGITMLGNGGCIWILISLGLLCSKKTRKLGWICGISLLLMLLVTNGIIKPLVARQRPYEAIEALQALVPPPHGSSFPSGHTASAFAVAIVLFRNMKKQFGGCFLALAILISLSRIYVGVHYPTDVLGGLLLGIICAFLAQCLYEFLAKLHHHRNGNESAAS